MRVSVESTHQITMYTSLAHMTLREKRKIMQKCGGKLIRSTARSMTPARSPSLVSRVFWGTNKSQPVETALVQSINRLLSEATN